MARLISLFLLTVLLASLASTACNTIIPGVPLSTFAPSNSTPLSTETFTPTETTTPPATQTPTEQQAEPGTMVLDSEYNLGGKVEIIPENSKAFYNYLMTALYDDNPLYFQAHPELGATADDFINYIKTHDSIPAGLKIPTGFRDGGYLRLAELEQITDLRNPDMAFVSYDQYQILKNNGSLVFSGVG